MSLRFKKTRKRRFTVLHAAVDTDTLMIHSVRVRIKPGGDAKELVPLLKRVLHQCLECVYSDKAHISRKSIQFIAELGACAAIEPKKNLGVNSRGHRAYGQLMREYRASPEE